MALLHLLLFIAAAAARPVARQVTGRLEDDGAGAAPHGREPISSADAGRHDDFYTRSASDLTARLKSRDLHEPARRVLVMISDGMGANIHYAARLLLGQRAGLLGEEHMTELDTFPHMAATKTHTVDWQTADSAGSGTAIHSGVKIKSGMLNCKPTLNRGACNATHHCGDGRLATDGKKEAAPTQALQPLARMLAAHDVGVGVVSTARLTHATPASLYANSAERDWEEDTNGCPYQKDIALQLAEALQDGTLTVAFGGGIRSMVPTAADSGAEEAGDGDRDAAAARGQRVDGRDLLEEMREEGEHMAVITDMKAWRTTNFSAQPGRRYYGSFWGTEGGSHLSFNPMRDAAAEPSLVEMTRAAIQAMEASHDKWYLTVESARPDHALHGNNLALAIEETAQFLEAVALARNMLPEEETTIIVTADHSHGLAFKGYCGRGSSPLGYCKEGDAQATGWSAQPSLPDVLVRDSEGLPVPVSGFATGPGSPFYKGPLPLASHTRLDRSEPQAEEHVVGLGFVQEALSPMVYGTHSGEDTMAWAWGTRSSVFRGTVDNTFIHHAIRYALDI